MQLYCIALICLSGYNEQPQHDDNTIGYHSVEAGLRDFPTAHLSPPPQGSSSQPWHGVAFPGPAWRRSVPG